MHRLRTSSMSGWHGITSRKVKSAFKTKFAEGAHYGAYAPIGYKKHPEIKGKIIPDDETRWIVEKIFSLAYQGNGGAKITKTLIEEKVPTPSWINCQRYRNIRTYLRKCAGEQALHMDNSTGQDDTEKRSLHRKQRA